MHSMNCVHRKFLIHSISNSEYKKCPFLWKTIKQKRKKILISNEDHKVPYILNHIIKNTFNTSKIKIYENNSTSPLSKSS